MATITKTPSNIRKAVVRKRDWPVTTKTFRSKCDAADGARSTEDEMVGGATIGPGPGLSPSPAAATSTRRPE